MADNCGYSHIVRMDKMIKHKFSKLRQRWMPNEAKVVTVYHRSRWENLFDMIESVKGISNLGTLSVIGPYHVCMKIFEIPIIVTNFVTFVSAV